MLISVLLRRVQPTCAAVIKGPFPRSDYTIYMNTYLKHECSSYSERSKNRLHITASQFW